MQTKRSVSPGAVTFSRSEMKGLRHMLNVFVEDHIAETINPSLGDLNAILKKAGLVYHSGVVSETQSNPNKNTNS